MRKASVLAVLSLALVSMLSGCVVSQGRYGRRSSVVVEPEFWGTVTYVDPASRWIDLDYVDAGRHTTRRVYYDTRNTQWDGVAYSDLRPGVQISVRGRNNRGRYSAERIRRH